MKHIVLYSGGAASSYVAYLVFKEQKKEDVILLHTPTYAEHPDADRFRKQVADYIGLSITVQEDGRDLWEVIDDNNCLPSNFIPFCTRILKQEQADKFYKSLNEDFIIYVGFDSTEWRRVQKQTARFEHMGYKSRYPLFENKISNEYVKNQIKNVWKICLPEPYKYLEHNNCIPCFKAGKNHFRQVAKYYPEYFKKAMEKELQLGHTVFKDCTLMDIWDEVQHMSYEEISILPSDYGVPCMCAL